MIPNVQTFSTGFAPPQGDAIQRAGAPIWDNLYEMRLAYMDTLAAETITRRGTLFTGNKQLDRFNAQEPVHVVINIDKMVEYFKEGVTITFRNPGRDCREVYDLVNNYLLAWRVQLENGLNLGNVPVQDLMDLDRFAEKIYPLALQFGAAPRNTGSFFGNMFAQGNGQFLMRGKIFAPTDDNGQVKPDVPEKHDPHANELTKSIARLRSHWT